MKVKKWLFTTIQFLRFSRVEFPIDGTNITHNLVLLQQTAWFQTLIHDEKVRQLIISDPDIRYYIGSLNRKRLEKQIHHPMYQKNIEKRIAKKQQYAIER